MEKGRKRRWWRTDHFKMLYVKEVYECERVGCERKRSWMSLNKYLRLPRKVPRRHGTNADQARQQTQPDAKMVTPATWTSASATAMRKQRGCHQVPRLPRKSSVDVTKCHACHARRNADVAKCNASHGRPTTQCCKCHVCHVKRKSMPPTSRPRQSAINVTESNTCHAKWRGARGDQRGPKRVACATKCAKELCAKECA